MVVKKYMSCKILAKFQGSCIEFFCDIFSKSRFLLQGYVSFGLGFQAFGSQKRYQSCFSQLLFEAPLLNDGPPHIAGNHAI